MFQRFHAMREEREGGFTLIELLVVILIIAILAAIAIPVFLNQRKKGWTAQVQSALKNAATAEETWLTSNTNYATAVSDLSSVGFRYSTADVTMTDPISATGAQSYCLQATSAHDSTIVMHYSSDEGRPVDGACP